MRRVLWPVAAALIAACGEGAARGNAAAAQAALTRGTTTVEVPPGPDSSKIKPTGPFAVPAELPNAQVDVTMPVGARTVSVAAGANLQSALNRAKPGDELVIENGAVFTGNFKLPATDCSAWIIVRARTVPAGAGERMRPSLANTLPKLRTPNGQPALTTAAGACKWRLIGLDITHVNPLRVDEQYGLVTFGEGDGAVPSADIILDRAYVHAATSEGNVRRGIGLNGVRQAVIDSWISDIHSRGTDSQAIAGWGGGGPYLIRNNYLEGAGENIIFGGADPAFDGLVPSDIEIIGNHFFKPMSWKGGPWQVKNLLELKNAQRVLIEGNVFQNNWAAAQDGWAFIWASHNQYGGRGAWTVVRDVTFRFNIVDHVEGVFNLAERYEASAASSARFTITQNLMTNIGFTDSGDLDRMYLVSGNLADVSIEHNTGFAPTAYLQFADQSRMIKPRLTFRNNVGGGARYTYNSPLGDGGAMFAAYGVAPENVTGNVVLVAPEDASQMPRNNSYVFKLQDVGFALSRPDEPAGFALMRGSRFRGRTADGKDPGADIFTLLKKTEGVVVAR